MDRLLIRALGVSLFAFALVPAGFAAPAHCTATPLTLSEAEILLYTMPQSVQIRNGGKDVVWEQITSNAADQEDYFVFQLFSTAPARIVPVVGNYAVNKHTADVVDISAEYRFVTSKQLFGVQKILRREHCITRQLFEEFRYNNPYAGGARLSPRDMR